jgi:hypothetical protein
MVKIATRATVPRPIGRVLWHAPEREAIAVEDVCALNGASVVTRVTKVTLFLSFFPETRI